jgi:hypothetical protein
MLHKRITEASSWSAENETSVCHPLFFALHRGHSELVCFDLKITARVEPRDKGRLQAAERSAAPLVTRLSYETKPTLAR